MIDDIHPPHEAAHSWRDIFIHLATITVGLFIALSLEGCVEWAHHRHLVHEARENIRSEIQDNQKDIDDALDTIHQEQKQVDADLATFASVQKNPKQHITINSRFSSKSLQHASWDTARETGALGYMPYAEVKSYSELQDLQQTFDAHSVRLIDAYTRGIAFLSTFHDGDPTADIAKSAPEGDRIARDVKSELLVSENIAEGLKTQYRAVLKQNYR